MPTENGRNGNKRPQTRKVGERAQPGAASSQDSERHFERNLAGAVRSTLDGKILDLNQAFLHIFGLSAKEEALGRHASEFYWHSAERKELVERLEVEGFLENVELSIRRADGSRGWVACNLSLVRDEGTGEKWIEGTLVDITHQRGAADGQENESAFRLLFSNNPHAMYVYDPKTLKFLEANAAATVQYGYTREEFLQMKLTDIRPAEEVPRLLEKLKGLGPGLRYAGQWTHRRKDSGQLDVEVTLHSLELNGRQAVLAVAQDITSRKNTEREIEERTTFLNALIENNPLAVVVLNSDYRVKMCNPAFERLFGYGQAEIAGRNLDDFISPENLTEEAAGLSREAIAGKNVQAITRRRRKDGSLVDVEVHGVPLVANGKLIGGLGLYQDVTERKEAERALRESEARKSAILESALDCVISIDHAGRILEFNSAAERTFGYQRSLVLGRNLGELIIPPELRESYQGALARLAGGGDTTLLGRRFETQAMRADGMRLPVELSVTQIALDGPPTFTAYLRDISHQKQAEEALRRAEEKYRSIVENAVEGIFQTTPGGNYVSVNPALARMYGYASPEELASSVCDIGRQIYVDPKQREDFKQRMEAEDIVQGFEYHVFRRDGSRMWLSENARTVRDANGRILFYEGTVEDVTERKRAEQERQVVLEISRALNTTPNLDELLHLIHQSLKKVLYAENCFVALYDRASGLFHIPFFVDQYDTAPPPMKVGRSCTAYVFRTGQPQLIPEPAFQELVKAGEVELVGTPSPTWLGVPLNTPTGTIGVLVVQHYEDATAYSQRDLELLASVGSQIALAIERKRSEEALRESEARLRMLIEQLPAVLWTTDTEMRFTSSLGAGLARLGLKPNEINGKTLFEYFRTDDPEFPPIAAQRRAVGGDPITFEAEWDGRMYECHAEPLRDSAGTVVGSIGMALDVTDRRGLEDQLRQAQKMEAVGRLAGGVAHDFNNLLMVIQGYGELLMDRLPGADPLRRNAEEIKKAAARAASLTRQLLAFSRKQVLEPKVLDINTVVADMEKILQRLIGEDIELVSLLRTPLGRVKADRGQVEQVILNLAVNARDAMPQGGKLTIETSEVELDANYARQHASFVPGPYIMLAVTDTGVGMDADTQKHIFEPFFTTKEQGKGTGLGLATVYGVVKQSGGYIWVYSEPGKGTTFKVYLPCVEETVLASDRPGAHTRAPRGTETVLLAEDEEGVRKLTREYLESSGYNVLEAESPAAAARLAKEYPEPIHLLMTDVVMPAMSGRELADRVMSLRPGIKVLYMSGYTDQAIVHHGILEANTVLLQKPFTLNTLARKLREVLEFESVK